VVNRGGLTFAAPLLLGALSAPLLPQAAPVHGAELLGAVLAAFVFGLLGWLDDARGGVGARGLVGHFRRLVRGEVTTGLVKAVGGALTGLWAAYMLGVEGWAILPAGAVIALSANTSNALDVRPGRTAKVYVVLALALAAWGCRQPLGGALVPLAALLGATLVLLPADLGERVMLGDTGANPLGCALGLAAVSITAWPVWLAVAAGLLAFCLAADRWSLTELFARNRALRWFDELGRPIQR